MSRHRNKEPVTVQGAKVEVRNGDVNQALRKLKKILDNDNRQKELAKREYFEKDSIKGRRSRIQAKKRSQRDVMKALESGDSSYSKPTGVKWMKSKRKRRRVLDNETVLTRAIRNKR